MMKATRQWVWNHTDARFEPYAIGEAHSIETLEDASANGDVFVQQDEHGRFWFISANDSSRWHDGEELDMDGERYDKARLLACG